MIIKKQFSELMIGQMFGFFDDIESLNYIKISKSEYKNTNSCIIYTFGLSFEVSINLDLLDLIFI